MMCVRFPLSLRQIEDILHERGIEVSYETMRPWRNRFGPLFAADIRKKRVAAHPNWVQWRWHLDEAFVRINGETFYLWRAVDHEGEVLETIITRKRDRRAALRFLRKAMKRYGRPKIIATDKLQSYRAAMKMIGNDARQETGRWLNNRTEHPHRPFRRREKAMPNSGAQSRYRNSPRSILQCTTISTEDVIFTTVEFSRSIAHPPWQNGASSLLE